MLDFIRRTLFVDSRDAHLTPHGVAPQSATVKVHSSTLILYRTLVVRLWRQHLDGAMEMLEGPRSLLANRRAL